MARKHLLPLIFCTVLCVPTVASAALTGSQVSAIIGLLQSFGADASVIANVEASLLGKQATVAATAAASSCLSLSHNLYLGTTDAVTGGDVSKLQLFLGGQVTGYFGPTTLQLVQSWQSSHSIVSSGTPSTTGYGAVGPQTRSAIQSACVQSSLSTTQPTAPETTPAQTMTPTNVPPVISSVGIPAPKATTTPIQNLVNPHTLAPLDTRFPQSIMDDNLGWQTNAVQAERISALAQLPAAWYRDTLHPNVISTETNLLKQIQAQGKNLLVLITPEATDYVHPTLYYGGTAFQNLCGWPGGQYRLSEIDTTLLSKRLIANLTALKQAGVQVGAFEIGNELDWVCYNADLPFSGTGNIPDDQLMPYAQAYARFLDTSIAAIKRPDLYPDAEIVTFGTANTAENTTLMPAHAIAHPGKLIALLKNLDGVNHLSQVDRIGVHLYTDPDHPEVAASALKNFAAENQTGLPVWITEWGFPNSIFSNNGKSPSGKTRLLAFQDYYSAVKNSGVPVDNMFLATLGMSNWSLMDSAGALLPEASFFSDPVGPASSAVPVAPVAPASMSYACAADGKSVALSWTSSAQATGYYPRIVADSWPQSTCPVGWTLWSADHKTCSIDNMPGRSVVVPVTPDTTYGAYVFAGDSSGANWNSSSGTGSFTCKAPPLPPAPASISYACSTDGKSVTLSWPAAPGATSYYPRLSGFLSCAPGWTFLSNVCYEDNIAATSVTYNGITPGSTYSAWVHAGNGGGTYAAWVNDGIVGGVNWSLSPNTGSFSCAAH